MATLIHTSKHSSATLGFCLQETLISIRTVSIVLWLLASVPACGNDKYVDHEEQIDISFVQRSGDLIAVSVTLPTDVVIENVRIRKDAHLNDWVLEFREKANLQVLSKDAALSERDFQIDEDTYADLIAVILSGLEVEYPNLILSRLQIDLDFVESTWRAVIAAVNRQAGEMTGSIEQMDRQITELIVETISNSEQVRATCDALEAHGRSCSDKPVSMNPVAFRSEVVGEPWTSLADYTDAAIQDSAWFTIRSR